MTEHLVYDDLVTGRTAWPPGPVFVNLKRYQEVAPMSVRITHEEVERRFTYHVPPKDEVVNAHNIVNNQFKTLAHSMVDNTPPGREQSLMITKLQEARAWANAAVACNHDYYEEGGPIAPTPAPAEDTTPPAP